MALWRRIGSRGFREEVSQSSWNNCKHQESYLVRNRQPRRANRRVRLACWSAPTCSVQSSQPRLLLRRGPSFVKAYFERQKFRANSALRFHFAQLHGSSWPVCFGTFVAGRELSRGAKHENVLDRPPASWSALWNKKVQSFSLDMGISTRYLPANCAGVAGVGRRFRVLSTGAPRRIGRRANTAQSRVWGQPIQATTCIYIPTMVGIEHGSVSR